MSEKRVCLRGMQLFVLQGRRSSLLLFVGGIALLHVADIPFHGVGHHAVQVGVAAQNDPLHGESIARVEKGPDVLGRTNVVQHHRDGLLFHRGELFSRRSAEFSVGDSAQNGFGMVDLGGKSLEPFYQKNKSFNF